jgi:2-oxoglutarate ferredoxin oxidoreductase subunit alpha
LAKPLLEKKPGAAMTLVGWGSTSGAIKEAANILESEGTKVNTLHLNEIWPLPVEAIASALGETKKSIVIENNATGQLAHLIAAETGIQVSASILKFDGRPFSPEYIVREIKRR